MIGLLLPYLGRISTVLSKEIGDLPIIGLMLRVVGTTFIDRSNLDKAKQSLAVIAKSIHKNNVCLNNRKWLALIR